MSLFRSIPNYSLLRRSFATSTKSSRNDRFVASNIEQKGKILNVEWKDNHNSRFHYIWLRDHCKCPMCVQAKSGQKQYNPADIPEKLALKTIQISPKEPNQKSDTLSIGWSDGHASQYELNWLRENCYSDVAIQERAVAERKKIKPWTKSDLQDNIPTLTFNNIMKTEEGLWEWLYYLKASGLCIVKDVPTELNTITKVAERISYIRETMYGKVFDVVSVPDAINIAYTPVKLDFHQDLLYYEAPPGLQFLHCIKAEAKGGDNLFQDGFKAADILKKKHPDYFNTLTKVPTTYHKQGVDHSMFYKKHVIVTDNNGNVIDLNYSPPFGGTLDIPFKFVEEYYEAYKAFTKIIRSPELAVSHRLKPGELVSFNNRRVFHARTAFDPNSGERHLQGIYIDLDEFESRYRTLSKRFVQ